MGLEKYTGLEFLLIKFISINKYLLDTARKCLNIKLEKYSAFAGKFNTTSKLHSNWRMSNFFNSS